MNYQTRLERLRERFLRANTKPLFDSACVEGGAILIHGQQNGVLHVNKSITEIPQGVTSRNPSGSLIQAMYFRCFASLEGRDATFHLSQGTGEIIVQCERYAAFCLELIDSLVIEPAKTQLTPDELKYQQAIDLFKTSNTPWTDITEQVGEERSDWSSFRASVVRFATKSGQELPKRGPGAKRKK